MRWTWKNPKEGDVRIRKVFLWLPTRIDDEVRWLEKTVIKEVYFWSWSEGWWYKSEFIDEMG